MTLEEIIKHCENVADYDCFNDDQRKCSEEHRRIAEWLKEIKENEPDVETENCSEIPNSYPAAQPEPEWIPVTERMPELDEAGYSEKVLVCCRNTSIINIAEYRMVDGIGDWYIGDLEDKFTDFGCPVLAWMPLPERYHDPL